MYNLHYRQIKIKCDANLLLTHTDSLVYEFETNDVFEDFYEDNYLFDFSDYPQHSNFFDPLNKILVK